MAGGKYTTYRVMAKDAVDEAVNGLARKVPSSTTQRLPLLVLKLKTPLEWMMMFAVPAMLAFEAVICTFWRVTLGMLKTRVPLSAVKTV